MFMRDFSAKQETLLWHWDQEHADNSVSCATFTSCWAECGVNSWLAWWIAAALISCSQIEILSIRNNVYMSRSSTRLTPVTCSIYHLHSKNSPDSIHRIWADSRIHSWHYSQMTLFIVPTKRKCAKIFNGHHKLSLNGMRACVTKLILTRLV